MGNGMGGAFKDPKEGIGIGLKKSKDGPDKDKVEDAPGGKATIEVRLFCFTSSRWYLFWELTQKIIFLYFERKFLPGFK